jgi:hypothetical protein
MLCYTNPGINTHAVFYDKCTPWSTSMQNPNKYQMKNHLSFNTNEYIEFLFRDHFKDFINSQLILDIYVNSFCPCFCLKRN